MERIMIVEWVVISQKASSILSPSNAISSLHSEGESGNQKGRGSASRKQRIFVVSYLFNHEMKSSVNGPSTSAKAIQQTEHNNNNNLISKGGKYLSWRDRKEWMEMEEELIILFIS